MLQPLEVVCIDDAELDKPKFVVCVEPTEGLYFRINSKGHHTGSVPLAKHPEHGWLDHDSFVQCYGPLALDDYLIERALDRYGTLGFVSTGMIPAILAATNSQTTMSPNDKALIEACLLMLA